MLLLELFLIAVVLAIDAFAISLAVGVKLRQVTQRQAIRLGWHFGFFQSAMLVLGWHFGYSLHKWIEPFDHWAAFVLLLLVGGRMIIGSFGSNQEEGEITANEPTRGWSLVVLSVITSIDAAAIGLSLAMMHTTVWVAAIIVGVVAAVLTFAGIYLGGYLGRRMKYNRYATLLGGLILIMLSGRILYEHGVF